MMQIYLNGALVETEAQTLAGLLIAQTCADHAVATAVDGMFVARGARAQTRLHPGARIEILTPMQGG